MLEATISMKFRRMGIRKLVDLEIEERKR